MATDVQEYLTVMDLAGPAGGERQAVLCEQEDQGRPVQMHESRDGQVRPLFVSRRTRSGLCRCMTLEMARGRHRQRRDSSFDLANFWRGHKYVPLHGRQRLAKAFWPKTTGVSSCNISRMTHRQSFTAASIWQVSGGGMNTYRPVHQAAASRVL